jgi:hypothetical protein
MINSVITPTVTYAMCSLKLPIGVIENIDRIVQKPKHKGGLGVLNLKLQNDALLLKQLLKFYNHENIPWVNLIWSRYYTSKVPHLSHETGSFWWKDLLRLHILFRGIAKFTIGNGVSVSFWEDLWTG